jgi:hypothetical protein
VAKAEIRAIPVWQADENLVCQRAGRRENDFASSITFDERLMIAELIARRGLTSPLINKDFRVCHLLLARGEFASVHLNHQK